MSGTMVLVGMVALVALNLAILRALRLLVLGARGHAEARLTGEERSFTVRGSDRALLAAAALGAGYVVAALIGAGGFAAAGDWVEQKEVAVIPDEVAARAGMLTGDRIVKIAGTTVTSFADVREAVRQHPAEPIAVEVDRGGAPISFTLTPDQGRIGVRAVRGREELSPVAALAAGLQLPVTWARGFVSIVAPPATDVLGPVGIVKEVAAAAPVSELAAVLLRLAFCQMYILALLGPLAAWSASPRVAKAGAPPRRV